MLILDRFLPGGGWVEIAALTVYAALVLKALIKIKSLNTLVNWWMKAWMRLPFPRHMVFPKESVKAFDCYALNSMN